MSADRGVLRTISWRDLCPWMILFRSFTMAMNPSIILLATAGLLLTAVGWWIGEVTFVGAEVVKKAPDLERVLQANHSTYGSTSNSSPLAGLGVDSNSGVNAVYWNYARPFTEFFSSGRYRRFESSERLGLVAYFFFGGLWTLAIWSIFAGAITRISALRFARDEGCSLKDAFRFSAFRFPSYFGGPGIPILIVFVLGIFFALPGLVMGADIGALIVSLGWILILVAGIVAAFLMLGLFFGWFLMFPTISTEGSDSFDAMSRCYAYVIQRPMHYIGYVFVSLLIGSFCCWIAVIFGETAIGMANWMVAWGAGEERIMEIMAGKINEEGVVQTTAAGKVIWFWNSLLRTLVTAYTYGLFWSLATGVYLLMRMAVDETEIDEIYVDQSNREVGLPDLGSSQSDESNDTQVPAEKSEPAASTSPPPIDEPNEALPTVTENPETAESYSGDTIVSEPESMDTNQTIVPDALDDDADN